jgi:hypothetical protein
VDILKNNMVDFFNKIIITIGEGVNKYFPIYIDWLTLKLQGHSSFGMLSLVGFLAVFFFLIYTFVRRGDDY